MNESNSIQAALDAGMQLAELREIDGVPIAVLPAGAHVADLEKYALMPLRKKGVISLRDVASFAAYVNAECTEDTRLYGIYNPPSFTAVLNDHGSDAGWRDYIANYACPLSPEWVTWVSNSGKQMSQADFAGFIENNLPDIAGSNVGTDEAPIPTPTAAEMLEISRSLEAKKKVNFASGARLSNGSNELVYEEEVSGTANKGKLQVPELFTVGVAVLEGGVLYAVQCRLRYRIADAGKLTMWYELVRPHKILEDAVKAVWLEIEQKTGLTVFNGKP